MSRPAARVNLGSMAVDPGEANAMLGLNDNEQAIGREMELARAAAAGGYRHQAEAVDAVPRYEEPKFAPEPTLAEVLAQIEELKKVNELRNAQEELRKLRATMAEAVAAKASVPEYDPTRDSPQTWILMQDIQEEANVAEAWVNEHCPVKREQRMLETCLDMAALRKEDTVICLIRGKSGRAPRTLSTVLTSPQGEKLSMSRPVEELMIDMSLSKPIHCADHWHDGGGFGRYSGSLDQAGFVNALGAVCSPLMPKFKDVASAVKGALPRYLELRYL